MYIMVSTLKKHDNQGEEGPWRWSNRSESEPEYLIDLDDYAFNIYIKYNQSNKTNQIIFSPDFDANISKIIKHIWIIVRTYSKYMDDQETNESSINADFWINLITICFLKNKQAYGKVDKDVNGEIEQDGIISTDYTKSFRTYIEYIMIYPGLIDIDYQLLNDKNDYLRGINTFKNYDINKKQVKEQFEECIKERVNEIYEVKKLIKT